MAIVLRKYSAHVAASHTQLNETVLLTNERRRAHFCAAFGDISGRCASVYTLADYSGAHWTDSILVVVVL